MQLGCIVIQLAKQPPVVVRDTLWPLWTQLQFQATYNNYVGWNTSSRATVKTSEVVACLRTKLLAEEIMDIQNTAGWSQDETKCLLSIWSDGGIWLKLGNSYCSQAIYEATKQMAENSYNWSWAGQSQLNQIPNMDTGHTY